MLLKQLEAGATVYYRIIDGTDVILDPLNPLTREGFEPASVVRMPESSGRE